MSHVLVLLYSAKIGVIFMIVGVPREVKNNEKRVALTPSGVTTFTTVGNQVLIESSAVYGSGFHDEEYLTARAGS